MIMPCMNSTSAGDRGGRVPFVDGGSVLLGFPGAPVCTTTGFAGLVEAESACCTPVAGPETSVAAKTPPKQNGRVAYKTPTAQTRSASRNAIFTMGRSIDQHCAQ